MRAVRSVFHGQSSAGDPIAMVELTGVIWREGSDWVSQCVELDVASFGSSPEEAVDQLSDAVCAYLNTLEELGERQAVLDAKRVRVYQVAPADNFRPNVPRALLDRDDAQIRLFSVPLPTQQPAYA